MVSWQGGIQDRLITFGEKKKSLQIYNTETNRQERKLNYKCMSLKLQPHLQSRRQLS